MLEQRKLAVNCFIFLIIIGFILGGSRLAWGHTFDNYGFGSRAIAMGGSMVGSDTDYTAVYYNPAGMAFHEGKDLSVGASYLYSIPSLSIKGTGPNPAASRSNVFSDQGISLGLSTPLRSGKIAKVISAGIGIYMPYPLVNSIIELRSYDPTQPYFIQYENRNQFLMANVGLSYKAWEKLAFGVGADILIHLHTTITAALVNNQAKAGLDAKFPLDIAPTAGIQYHPTDWLSLGVAYHGKTQIKVAMKANIMAKELIGSDVPVTISFQDAYKPQQVEMGFGAKPMKDLLVSGTLTWVDFSSYVPPYPVIAITTNEKLAGLAQIAEQYLPKFEIMKFKDYWIPRLGLEYKVTEHLNALAGYFYRDSAVRKQLGQTSFIDLPTNGISAGIGITFSDPLNILDNDVKVDFAYQGQFLQKSTVIKADPVYQSYIASGSSHLITGTLSYLF